MTYYKIMIIVNGDLRYVVRVDSEGQKLLGIESLDWKSERFL